MKTAIAIVILILVAVFALKGALKRVRGGGSCCGAGGGAPFVQPKELEGPVIVTLIAEIEGMHCDSCKSKVEKAINSVDGIKGEVSLHNKTLTVESARTINPEEIIEIVNKAGYKVVSTAKSL